MWLWGWYLDICSDCPYPWRSQPLDLFPLGPSHLSALSSATGTFPNYCTLLDLPSGMSSFLRLSPPGEASSLGTTFCIGTVHPTVGLSIRLSHALAQSMVSSWI